MRATASHPSRFHPSRSRLIALGILALALAIRLWDLNARSLWLDEGVEYWVANVSLSQLPSTVRDVIQDPPFYSLLLHLWMDVSRHEAWLRLLSVLFGIGGVLGVMVAAYRLQGWASSFAAGLLMAILPTAVRYSQDVGQYAPMQCFLVWSIVALIGLASAPRRGGYIGWGLAAVAAVYAYYGSFLTAVIPFLCLLAENVRRREWPRVRSGLWTLAAFGVATLPLFVYFLPRQIRRGPTGEAFEPAAVESLAHALSGAGKSLQAAFAFQFTGWPCTPVPAWLTILVVGLLTLLAVRRQWRIAAWFAATLVTYGIAGWLHLFPFGLRYGIILIPLMVPMMACAFAGTRLTRMGAGLAFGVLCAQCVVSLPNRTVHDRMSKPSCSWPETEDIREVTRYWFEHRQPNQATYVYYGAAPAFAYYLDRLRGESLARPSGWFMDCWRGDAGRGCRDGTIYYGRWLRTLDTDAKLKSVFETMGRPPAEFWFVMAHVQGDEAMGIGERLTKEYAIIDSHARVNASAVLLRRLP